MKKSLIILLATMFLTLTVKGQNLFFIGENSYPCTETITLQSNSDEWYIDDLKVLFAKDGKSTLFFVSAKTEGDLVIQGKLIIYLDDGTVITLKDNEIFEYVNKVASSMYNLTNEELSKMKKSNINTIRYTLTEEDGSGHPYGGNFSASNKGGINTKRLISDFVTEKFVLANRFEEPMKISKKKKREQEQKKTKLEELMGGIGHSDGDATGSEGNDDQVGDKGQPDGDPYANSYYGDPGTGSGGVGYGLKGRGAPTRKIYKQECNESGLVVVSIEVDRNGTVIKAKPGVRGTTNNASCLIEPAKKIALSHKWRQDSIAPARQIGFVSVNFKLGQ